MSEIHVFGGKVAKVSDVDDDLKRFKWALDPYGYPRRNISLADRMAGRQNSLSLHREVTSRKLKRILSPHELVDHINGDKLDARRENLRIVSLSDNMANRAKSAGKSSGFKGVAREKRLKTWQVHVYQNKRLVKVGLCDDEVLAAEIYDVCMVFLRGGEIRINFPDKRDVYQSFIINVGDPIKYFRHFHKRLTRRQVLHFTP
jgi:hypothetical protein